MQQNSRVSVPRRAKPWGAVSPGLPLCLCRCPDTSEPGDVAPATQHFDKDSLAAEETREDKCMLLSWPLLVPLFPGFKGSQLISGAVLSGSRLGMNSER